MKLFKNINLDKLKSGLSKTREKVFTRITETITGKAKLDDATLEELEEILISSDIGVETTDRIIENTRVSLKSEGDRTNLNIVATIQDELVKSLKEHSNGTNEFEQYYEEETKEAGDHGHWNYEDGDDVEINIPSKYKTESDATRFIKTQLDDPKDFDKFSMVWYPEMTYARFYSQFFDDWKLKREAKIWTISDEKYEEWMRDLVSDYEFDLKGAIISNNEVMVNCNKYYGIDARVHGWSIDNYIKKFGVKGHKSDEELAEWWRKDMKKS